jgi:hypothetical protein
MQTNARVSTLKVWRFEYERPPLRTIYDREVDAASLIDAIHLFRDVKPEGRIVSIDGIRYYDDGRALYAYGFPSRTDAG